MASELGPDDVGVAASDVPRHADAVHDLRCPPGEAPADIPLNPQVARELDARVRQPGGAGRASAQEGHGTAGGGAG